MGRKSSKNPKAARPPAPPTPEVPIRRGRLWTFRIVAMTVVPLLFFAGLELALRAAGFGYESRFVVRDTADGRPVVRDNPDFTQRFFPPPLFRSPHPFILAHPKPPGTYRIFVLGESAAMGDPAPAFGFGRILEVLLRDRYPERRFEVVNAAVTAINSHAVRDVARDVARHEPDLILIYMGNNEVVGPYGAGTVFSPGRQSLTAIRAQLRLKTFRVGQLADRLARTGGGARRPRRWEGMEMFLGHEVRATDAGLAAVYDHFRRNLLDIVGLARHAGAKVLLCTIGTNLKDGAPFASQHRPDLAPDDEARWQSHVTAGIEHETAARWSEALEAYTRADAIDAQHAELAFRQGRCRYALQQYADAARDFARARDLDTLRFRADTTINRVIRETAAARALPLVDVEEALRQASPHGVPGEESFYEHVHLTFDGNFRVAVELLKGVVAALPGGGDGGRLSVQECAARLGWTEWHERRILRDVIGRFARAPFTGQLDRLERGARFDARLTSLEGRLAATAPEPLIAAVTAAAARDSSWEMQENLAQILEGAGKSAEAIAAWERVLANVPHYTEAHGFLGKLLLARQRPAEALAHFEAARHLRPYAADVYNNVGAVHAFERRWDEALAAYRQALAVDPSSHEALVNTGIAHAAAGRNEEARHYYRRAVEGAGDAAEVQYQLGQFAYAIGMPTEALAHVRAALSRDESHAGALRLLPAVLRQRAPTADDVRFIEGVLERNPGRLALHQTLGDLLSASGRFDEAIPHYRAALAADPPLPNVHSALGQILRRSGRAAQAAVVLADGVKAFPDSMELRQRLASAYNESNDFEKAIDAYRQIRVRSPQDWISAANLAWILAASPDRRFRNGAEAVRLGEEACALTGNNEPQALNTLAAAYAEAGRFGEALEAAEAAFRMATALGKRDLARNIQGLAARYERGQPYPLGKTRARS
jgi:tetratricopeptide (TPR) repeat protein